ncbi:MAG: 50S ribosomal protein L24 [Actinobacteria bacterium]|jgi:large subunit ribosomal protein L24|nr:50S ribosomal protein L24 [Actinomycetota bacterium]
MKIKKGDNVIVISGKDKGKEGTVSRVMPRSNQLLVDGINVVKKHQKPSGKNQQGGVIDRDMPLDASNVMFVHKGKPTRVGYKVLADGKKVRIAKTTGEEIG